MADIEVHGAETEGTTIRSLRVRFQGTAERTISRETALSWLAGGHSMIATSGSGSHRTRGLALERVEVGGEAFIRTDTRLQAADHVELPGAH
ncbi:hypothetical protein LBMAG42_14380 [Deltaproteobacteria bacterium]|nr:hypothetical protein LBMAG42_14380 [Deltaproteobacteria bacterium]